MSLVLSNTALLGVGWICDFSLLKFTSLTIAVGIWLWFFYFTWCIVQYLGFSLKLSDFELFFTLFIRRMSLLYTPVLRFSVEGIPLSPRDSKILVDASPLDEPKVIDFAFQLSLQILVIFYMIQLVGLMTSFRTIGVMLIPLS